MDIRAPTKRVHKNDRIMMGPQAGSIISAFYGLFREIDRGSRCHSRRFTEDKTAPNPRLSGFCVRPAQASERLRCPTPGQFTSYAPRAFCHRRGGPTFGRQNSAYCPSTRPRGIEHQGLHERAAGQHSPSFVANCVHDYHAATRWRRVTSQATCKELTANG
jgi:hypothetical protein